jgi:DNA-binding GntR family transcriptional regulator
MTPLNSTTLLATESAQEPVGAPTPPFFSVAQNGSAHEISRQIIRDINDGRLVVGQKLIESQLCKRFGVARGTIRDALRRLADEEIVTITHNRGASITWFTRKQVDEALQLVELLSGFAAALAARRQDQAETKEQLRRLAQDIRKHKRDGNGNEFRAARDRFLIKVQKLSGNDRLGELLRIVHVNTLCFQFLRTEGKMAASADIYLEIAEAIIDGDETRAETAMKRHVANLSDVISVLPDEEFAVPDD